MPRTWEAVTVAALLLAVTATEQHGLSLAEDSDHPATQSEASHGDQENTENVNMKASENDRNTSEATIQDEAAIHWTPEHKEGFAKSGDSDSEASQRNKFFLWAHYTTTTKFKLSFTTSTIPATCFTAIDPAICMGRRRRSLGRLTSLKHGRPQDTVSLSPSLHDVVSHDEDVSQDDGDKARKLLTVWSTAFSTKTATSYFVNTSVTARVSAQCSIMGIAFPACPGK